MTFNFDNVYINDTYIITGPIEGKSKYSRYFNKIYDDFYFGEKSFEKSEIKLVRESIFNLLRNNLLENKDVDIVFGGDLLNQICASTYGCYGFGNGFVGIYGACSTSTLGICLASALINSGYIKNSVITVSSHNLSSEKQFRFPVEYGSLRKKSSTFTSTGAASILLSKYKSDVKVESCTIGKIIDDKMNDPNDMGKCMAAAFIDTLETHLKEKCRDIDYYDLILSGDLGIYGRDIVLSYYLSKYNKDIYKIYNDCGAMLYDGVKNSNINAGGSGPVCSALINYGYIYNALKKKKYKKVLLVATGALFSPCLVHQGENINSISYAVSLEAI